MIALKDQPANFGGRGGMRSPLAVSGGQGANLRATAPSENIKRNAEAGGQNPSDHKSAKPAMKAAQGRQVSEIRGIHDDPSVATHLSHVMYDRSPTPASKFGVIFALVVAIAGGGVMFAVPKAREQVAGAWKAAFGQVVGLVRHRKKKQPVSYNQVHTAQEDDDNIPTATRVAPVHRTCSELNQTAAGMSGTLMVADRVDLAECYLVADDPANAEAALRPLETKIASTSEGAFAGTKAIPLANAYLTLLDAYLRQGKVHDAGELLRNRCLTWGSTPTCVGKAMLLANRKLVADGGGADGIQTMFTRRGGDLDGKSQARLWLAGAELAAQAGQAANADKRYGVALATAPKDAWALRKQIYEVQAVDLYNRGNMVALRTAAQKGLMDLKSQSPNSRLKLQILFDLVTSPNKAKTLRAQLSREDITYRARGDFELIDILGPESLRAGLGDDYVRLIKRTREYYTSRYKTLDSSVARGLAVWEVRAALAANGYDDARALLQSYEKQFGADAMSHHLRGVAFAAESANEHYQLQAAGEFQAALKLKSGWESLYALGATLLRANKDAQVAAIIKDLDRTVQTNGQKYWAEMLKAEWYIHKEKFLNAQKILTTWSAAEPDRYNPRQLQLLLYRKTGKTAEAQRTEAAIDDLARTRKYATSFEGYASPLGFMALARRPVD
jgi:hypothetical protein